MTYLHNYVIARDRIRKDMIPKLIAALMPTLDMLGAEYSTVFEGRESGADPSKADALIVTLPAGQLPDGYRLRIDFTAVSQVSWKAPDGTSVPGPGKVGF